MNLKKVSYLLVFMMCPLFFYGQIKISETIQASSIAKQDNNALYFVDFWATWCGPCIHVSKYLTSLQEQYPNDFYILSLTQENPDLVKRFMNKHKMNLAIAIDFEGEAFKKNKIVSLPYGILYNASGEKLWEGHPAELKSYHLDGYLETNKNKISVNSFFKLHGKETPVVVGKKVEKHKKDFEFFEDQDGYSSEVLVKNSGDYLELKGSLQSIIAYVLGSSNNQVEIPNGLNKFYKMYFKYGSKASESKELSILKAFKLKRTNTEKEGDVIVLDIKEPMFWDTEQINWGKGNPQYLVGDTEIQADNVTLSDVAYKLSVLLKTPIVFNENNSDNTLHDWQIHYKYFELMSSNLYDYGIEVEKKVAKYPQYIYSLE